MAREEIVLLAHQCLPAWILVRRARTARMRFHFQPALVILIHWLEERPWLGGMNQNGNLQARAVFKYAVETRIVHMDALSLGVLQIHAEVLKDFQTLCAVVDVALELRGRTLGVTRIVD